VLLQSRRLEVSAQLPEAKVLAKEMQAFKVKVTVAGNETFEAWRERDHDRKTIAACAGFRAVGDEIAAAAFQGLPLLQRLGRVPGREVVVGQPVRSCACGRPETPRVPVASRLERGAAQPVV
jgi:hypothetical protein